MIKVVITDVNEVILSPAYFSDDAAADAWIALHGTNCTWGKPGRWVTEDKEDISEALETRETEIHPAQEAVLDENDEVLVPAQEAVTITEYRLAAQFSVEKTDIGNELEMQKLRIARNQKLTACDWTQLSDAPLTNEQRVAWATYRQQLRDLPENVIDPASPIWPSEPA